jgi:hypothetical protein
MIELIFQFSRDKIGLIHKWFEIIEYIFRKKLSASKQVQKIMLKYKYIGLRYSLSSRAPASTRP